MKPIGFSLMYHANSSAMRTTRAFDQRIRPRDSILSILQSCRRISFSVFTFERRFVVELGERAENVIRCAMSVHRPKSERQVGRPKIETGLQDGQDENQLENDPRFLKRIAAARASLRETRGVELEDALAKLEDQG